MVRLGLLTIMNSQQTTKQPGIKRVNSPTDLIDTVHKMYIDGRQMCFSFQIIDSHAFSFISWYVSKYWSIAVNVKQKYNVSE